VHGLFPWLIPPIVKKTEDLVAFEPLRFIFKIKLKPDTFPKNYPASGSPRMIKETSGSIWVVQRIPTSYPQKYAFTSDRFFEKESLIINHWAV